MPSGIILLDKPSGLSSNGALQRVRKAFRARSAGHVGTLDPMATGMLPLCLEEATKVIPEIESGAKCYEFTLQLGARTDTGDAEGQIVEHLVVPPLDAAGVELALAGFRGPGQQVPPMYSALKREGRPLYELARKGVEVERAPRKIDIHRLDLIEQRADALDLICECGKGTYIRVLGEDIARRLQTCGHLTRLRRTWVQPFRDLPMISLEAVLAGAENEQNLLPPDVAIQHLLRVNLSPEQTTALGHGKAVVSDVTAAPGQRVRFYDPNGVLLGIGEGTDDGRFQPRRLMQI
jgi:tRNA pseudouridine55 synthase